VQKKEKGEPDEECPVSLAVFTGGSVEKF